MRVASLLAALLFAPALSAQTDADLLDGARAFPAMPQESVDLLQGGFVAPGDFTFGSGTPYNDIEYTAFDTDYMEGETNGYDTFMPVDPSEPFPGSGTVKLVRGVNNLDLEAAYDGPTGDRIILGTADVPIPFFLKGSDGIDDDYAVIQNYDYNAGTIQLRGTADEYRLLYASETDGVATEGHYLFYTGGGDIDLIAFIWPCDVLGSTVSGNPPRDDQGLCNDSKRLALNDGVNFIFAAPFPGGPSVSGALAQVGSTGKEIVGGVAADSQGNVYLIGATDGSLTGATDGSLTGATDGSLTGASAAENHLFAAQVRPDGSRGWTLELAVTNGTLLFDGTTDDTYLYAVGRTLGALDGFTNAGRWDAIVLKIDLASGEIVDTHQYGNPGLDGYGNAVLDGRGGLYVSGAGSSPNASGTDPDYLVAKYDTETLELVWTVTEAPAATGPVFVSEAWGGLSYAPATGERSARLLAGGWYMSAGGSVGFLSLYEGLDRDMPQRVAATSINSPGQQADWVLDNAIGADGRLYAAGYTTGPLGGPHQGDGDAFIVRFDSDLSSPVYVQSGTAQSDMFRKLDIGPEGTLFAVGYTYGDLASSNADPTRRTGDVLVQSYTADLDAIASAQVGTAGEDRGFSALANGVLAIGGMTEAGLAGPSLGSFDGFALALDLETLEVTSIPPVATEDRPDTESLVLSPNPTSGSVRASVAIERYTVTDLRGRVVLHGEAVSRGANIDLSALAPGIYIARLHTRDGLVTRPLVRL
ncbi:MAG: T9SS type A sorting domain-containing protein [Bacteroidota bacterium]